MVRVRRLCHDKNGTASTIDINMLSAKDFVEQNIYTSTNNNS
jgi:hypothetical protein